MMCVTDGFAACQFARVQIKIPDVFVDFHVFLTNECVTSIPNIVAHCIFFDKAIFNFIFIFIFAQ